MFPLYRIWSKYLNEAHSVSLENITKHVTFCQLSESPEPQRSKSEKRRKRRRRKRRLSLPCNSASFVMPSKLAQYNSLQLPIRTQIRFFLWKDFIVTQRSVPKLDFAVYCHRGKRSGAVRDEWFARLFLFFVSWMKSSKFTYHRALVLLFFIAQLHVGDNCDFPFVLMLRLEANDYFLSFTNFISFSFTHRASNIFESSLRKRINYLISPANCYCLKVA